MIFYDTLNFCSHKSLGYLISALSSIVYDINHVLQAINIEEPLGTIYKKVLKTVKFG